MSTHFDPEKRVEQCTECNRKTLHEIAIVTHENPDLHEEHRAFSREPLRKTECTECGHEETNKISRGVI